MPTRRGAGVKLLPKALGTRKRAALRAALSGQVWHARRDSNPQPLVLETSALPIELRASVGRTGWAPVPAGL
jgi:hypothetical protein